MNLRTARRNLEQFSSDRRKYTPTLTDDWKLIITKRKNRMDVPIDNWLHKIGTKRIGQTKALIKSESLDITISVSAGVAFYDRYLEDDTLLLVENVIYGTYAFSKNGLISEEEYYFSEQLVRENEDNEIIKEKDLEVGYVYSTDEDNYYVYMGERKESFLQKGASDAKEDFIINDELYNNKKMIIEINKEKYENGEIEVIRNKVSSTIKFSYLIEKIEDENYYKLKEYLLNTIVKTGGIRFKNKETPATKKEVENQRVFGWDAPSIIKYDNEYYVYEQGVRTRDLDWRNPEYTQVFDLITENIIDIDASLGYFKKVDIDKLIDFINSKETSINNVSEKEKYTFANRNIPITGIYIY